MRKNIKATNIELTSAIEDYIEKRFKVFDKFITGPVSNAFCEVEVGKTTHHHKSGNVFRAEVNLHVPGNDFYAFSERDDLYAAIDEVKDEILRKLKSSKEKRTTLIRRGALKVKNLLKGLDFWR